MSGSLVARDNEARVLRGLSGPALSTLYIAVALTPLLAAWLSDELPRNPWRALGSALALLGFAMLLLEFPLSGRFRSFSGKIGIDVTMRAHQRAAWGVLLLLLLHPFVYILPRLSPEPMRAVHVIASMFTAESNRSGLIAWLLLLALVPMGMFRYHLPWRYEIWRTSHGLGAALVAGLGLHHALTAGFRNAGTWLTAVWVTLTGLALVTLVFVYLVKPILQLRRPYRVTVNRQVGERSWELRVEPEHEGAIRFLPGQFAWLNLGHSPFSLTEHPFSISTAPADRPQIGFTIKHGGDFTDRIGEVPVGTRAWLDGPHGHFVVPPGRHERLVFIAGGVGFAPVMSILRQCRAERWPDPLCLVYGNRAESQILYRAELENMARELQLELNFVLSEPPPGWTGPVGQLSKQVLDRCLARDKRAKALYFVCGPPPMMRSVERSLKEFGVPAGRVIAEHFKYN